MNRAFVCILMLGIIFSCVSCADTDKADKAQLDFPCYTFDTEIKACPQRVVSLNSQATDIIVALGSDAQLIGVSEHCKINKDIAVCGTTAEPDFDMISELKADIILVTPMISEENLKELKKLSEKVIPVYAGSDFDELRSVYINIGRLMSGEITGVRNASSTFNKIEDKLMSVSVDKAKRDLVVIYYSADLIVFGKSPANELINYGGCFNAATSQDMTDEEVIAAGVDAILCRQEDYEKISKRFEGFKVGIYDSTLLESRSFDMVMAATALKEAVDNLNE